MEAKSIYEYLNYRDYIRDQIEALRSQGRYSNRSFNKKAGIGSPSYLKSIIDGKRNITQLTLRKIALALELNHSEILFFEKLVAFTHAKVTREKNEAFREILKSKGFLNVRHAARIEYELFSRADYVIVLEGASGIWRGKGPKEISKLSGIPESRVKEILVSLLKCGFLIERDGAYIRAYPKIETPPEAHSLNLKNYHLEMMDRAKFALEQLPSHQRDFQALTISASMDTFDEVKSRCQKFVRELAAEFGEDPSNSGIFQLNLQFFPLVPIAENEDQKDRPQ